MHGDLTASYSPPPAFGRFRVLHQVGAGRLGPVFRGHDPETGRLVAIKVFRLDLAAEKADELAAELWRVVQIDFLHPGIVALHAAGVEDMVPYLVEEYVSADSLDAALRQYGPAPVSQALSLLMPLAGALDFAAAAGVFHGALHPRDILVAPDDSRLTGLGVAGALERCGVRAPARRPYDAPERLAGFPPSREADVYSLAVCAHELLTGRRPVSLNDPLTVRVDGLGVDPEALGAVFKRALASRPEDRYGSAVEFVAGLEEALQPRREDALEGAPFPVEEAGDPVAGRAEDWALPDEAAEAGPPESRVPVASSGQDDPGPGEADGAAPLNHREPLGLLPFDLDVEDTASSERGPVPEPDLTIPEPELTIPEPEPDLANPGLETRGAILPDVEMRPPAAFGLGFEQSPEEEREHPRPVQPADSVDGPQHLPAAGRPGPADASAHPQVPPALLGSPERETVRARTTPDRIRSTSPAGPSGYRLRVAGLPYLLVLLFGVLVGFVTGYVFGVSRVVPAGGSATTAPLPARTTAPGGAASAGPGPEGAELPPAERRPAQTPAGRVAPPATPAPRPAGEGRIDVRSAPPGAAVALNGQARGTTPVSLQNLPAGRYAVRISLGGYVTEDRQVTLPRGQVTRRVAVTLRRPARPAQPPVEFVGSMLVESRPTGARVLLDGRVMGTTPLTLPGVDAGSHVVRLELAGHRPWTASVQVTAGQQAVVRGSLEPELSP